MPDEDHLHCQCCGATILPGGAFYHCKTEFISGFDGVLPDSPDPEADIEAALQQLKAISAQEAMDEIYENIELVLCPACRTKLQKAILAMLPDQAPPKAPQWGKARKTVQFPKAPKSKGKILPFPGSSDSE